MENNFEEKNSRENRKRGGGGHVSGHIKYKKRVQSGVCSLKVRFEEFRGAPLRRGSKETVWNT